MTNDTHTCPRCGIAKPVIDFAKDKSKSSGRKSTCKECDRAKAKKYYENTGRSRRGHVRADLRVHPNRILEVDCRECGVRFTPRNRGGIYCSRACSGKASRTAEPCPPKQLAILVCVVCKDLFDSWHPNNKTCSPECQKLNIKQRGRNSETRRRMRIKEGTYEPFQYTVVYKRDDWTCGLCGEAIDPKLEYPYRMSASLDHIVPLSQGGDHVMSNAQAAHWICNVKRGVRPLEVEAHA